MHARAPYRCDGGVGREKERERERKIICTSRWSARGRRRIWRGLDESMHDLASTIWEGMQGLFLSDHRDREMSLRRGTAILTFVHLQVAGQPAGLLPLMPNAPSLIGPRSRPNATLSVETHVVASPSRDNMLLFQENRAFVPDSEGGGHVRLNGASAAWQ
jgi:hypothetical protein